MSRSSNGKTNKEIALITGLKPSTVKDYVANACHKLGLEGRTALAVWYAKTATSSEYPGLGVAEEGD